MSKPTTNETYTDYRDGSYIDELIQRQGQGRMVTMATVATLEPPTYDESPPALPDVTYFLTGELPAEHRFYDPWAIRWLWWYRQSICPIAAYGRPSERPPWT